MEIPVPMNAPESPLHVKPGFWWPFYFSFPVLDIGIDDYTSMIWYVQQYWKFVPRQGGAPGSPEEEFSNGCVRTSLRNCVPCVHLELLSKL